MGCEKGLKRRLRSWTCALSDKSYLCTVSLFGQGCPFLASSGGQVERTRLSFYRLYRATCDLAPAPCARGGGTGRRRSGRKCGWRRTAHHYAHRSATRTPRASRAMQQGVATKYKGHGHLGHRWRAIPKRSGTRLHPRSQPAHSSRRTGPSAAGHAAALWLHAAH